jgi:hypothetical protein
VGQGSERCGGIAANHTISVNNENSFTYDVLPYPGIPQDIMGLAFLQVARKGRHDDAWVLLFNDSLQGRVLG